MAANNKQLTPHQILGVSSNCSYAEAKIAYKQRANKLHPDKGGDAKSFNQLSTAYEMVMGSFTKNKDINITLPVTLDVVYTGLNTELIVNTEYASKVVSISIPKGIHNGDVIKFNKCGDNTIKQLTPGDLFVNVKVMMHESFTRKGDDCIHHINVSAKNAMLGATVDVTDLAGITHKVNIPAGTQPYTMFTIKNEGFPQKNTCKRGDLHIYCIVTIPSIHDDKIRVCKLP